MAVLAQVIGAHAFGRSRLQSAPVSSATPHSGRCAALAGELPLFGTGRVELEQLAQPAGSRLVHVQRTAISTAS